MTEAEAKVELGLIPDAGDILNGRELKIFQDTVEKRIRLKAEVKETETVIAVLDDTLVAILCKHDHDKIMYGNHKVAIITKTNSRLDKERLLLNGVPAKVIAASMVTSQSSYLEVRERKGE